MVLVGRDMVVGQWICPVVGCVVGLPKQSGIWAANMNAARAASFVANMAILVWMVGACVEYVGRN